MSATDLTPMLRESIKQEIAHKAREAAAEFVIADVLQGHADDHYAKAGKLQYEADQLRAKLTEQLGTTPCLRVVRDDVAVGNVWPEERA